VTGRADARDVLSETFGAVLFDMDGTLLDSLAPVVRSWTRWAAEYGVSLQELRNTPTHGRPARDIVADFVPAQQVDAAYDRIVDLEIADTDGCVPLPGALAALVATGARSAVVTSCSAPLAAARLRAAGIPTPAVVVTADDVSRGKPDAEPFLLAAKLLGVEPAACLVVEDAPAGLAAAAAAGCAALALTTTHTADELSADLVVATLADVTLLAAPDGLRVRRYLSP